MKKAFIIAIAVIGLLASAIAFWLTRGMNAQPSHQNNQQQQQDVTATWKTYSNTKYGFEMKYPEDKFADVKVDQGMATGSQFGQADVLMTGTIKGDNGDDGRFSVVVSGYSVARHQAVLKAQKQELLETQELNVGGIKAAIYSTGSTNPDNYSETVTAAIPAGSKFMYVMLGPGPSFDQKKASGELSTNDLSLFVQLLSTIKLSK